jgi:hypothetical protein
MNTVETNFRSLSRSTAECQRHIERLQYVDSTTVQKEISELIRFDMRNLQQDVAVNNSIFTLFFADIEPLLLFFRK